MTTPEVSHSRSRIEFSSLYNADLAPRVSRPPHWGTYNFAALWISMSVNILTYMLAASLIQGGMNWKQAVMTIFLGKRHRPGSDAAELAPRRQVRCTFPGIGTRIV